MVACPLTIMAFNVNIEIPSQTMDRRKSTRLTDELVMSSFTREILNSPPKDAYGSMNVIQSSIRCKKNTVSGASLPWKYLLQIQE